MNGEARCIRRLSCYMYVGWSITIPLQVIAFDLISKAVGKPVGPAMALRLLGDTVAMPGFGFTGEAGAVNAMIGFYLGCAGGPSAFWSPWFVRPAG